MGFAQESGYTPYTIESIIDYFRVGINAQFGTSYTTDSFVGTNFYKFVYAVAQRVQANEIQASEVFAYLQQYIVLTNQRIARPAVTPQGLIDALTAAGYVASVKPIEEGDAGKIYVCVDVDDGADDYAATKLAINTILKNSTAAGCITQGDQTSSIVLSNGQSFDFSYSLPNVIDVKLKLTITTSENNQSVIKSTDDIKADLLANLAARYRLGKNFEPERYYGMTDAPWASVILLEYSLDGGSTYISTVNDSNFDDLFSMPLENITVVED